jgi:hypothetical protein
MTEQTLLPVEQIAATILTIRGQKVIIDADLARLYGVTTTRLNEQVKRNRDRFPDDFMFQLTAEEKAEVIAKCDNLAQLKFSPRPPHAFTEFGAVMAANVLNSPQAVRVSVYVVRAFVEQRALLATNAEVLLKLERMERKLLAARQVLRDHEDQLTAHDAQLEVLVETLHELMAPPATPRREIGFRTEEG